MVTSLKTSKWDRRPGGTSDLARPVRGRPENIRPEVAGRKNMIFVTTCMNQN